jgi:small GTP-binding protein
MIQKKICMLGSFAVGKTSLVRRFVHSLYSDKYHTTIGVKIEKKVVPLDAGRELTLMLWDIYGEDKLQKVRMSYLRGAAGYLLVVDSTRSASLAVAQQLHATVQAEVGALPYVLVLNKCDLVDQQDLDAQAVAALGQGSVATLHTSAATGAGVDEAFERLARKLLTHAA